MKKIIILILAFIPMYVMAQLPDTVNVGSVPGDTDADTVRNAFIKVNNNDQYLENIKVDTARFLDSISDIRNRTDIITSDTLGFYTDTLRFLDSISDLRTGLSTAGLTYSQIKDSIHVTDFDSLVTNKAQVNILEPSDSAEIELGATEFKQVVKGSAVIETFSVSKTIDYSSGFIKREITVTNDATITITGVGIMTASLFIIQDGTGGHTITISGATAIKNALSQETGANSITKLMFELIDGATYYYVVPIKE